MNDESQQFTGADKLDSFDELLDVLDLKRLDSDHFEGKSMQLGWARLYGGQVVSQSIIAAHRTIAADRFIHSIHCYFLRPGLPDVPLKFAVERLRDGGSFDMRRVVAYQHEKPIFTLNASFKIDEEGLEHHVEAPEVPQPEELPDIPSLLNGPFAHFPEELKSYWRKRRPMELRPIDLDHYLSRDPLPAKQTIWIRPLFNPDAEWPKLDRITAAAVLAYLSDMTLLDTSLFAHGRSVFDRDLQAASVDHAMWFHDANGLAESIFDWLLYTQDSPAAARACGLSRGQLYSRDGKLIASVAQEGLIRLRKHKLPKK